MVKRPLCVSKHVDTGCGLVLMPEDIGEKIFFTYDSKKTAKARES